MFSPCKYLTSGYGQQMLHRTGIVVTVRPGDGALFDRRCILSLTGGRGGSNASAPVCLSGSVRDIMGKLTALGSRVATLPPRVAVPAKRADTLYTSPEWKALVAEIKEERGAYCEDCGSGHRVAGDHEIEVKDGGPPLDKKNVRLRCQPCHNRKTAAARAKRAGLA